MLEVFAIGAFVWMAKVMLRESSLRDFRSWFTFTVLVIVCMTVFSFLWSK